MSFSAVADVPWGRCIYNRHDPLLGRCIGEYGEFSEGEIDVLRMVTPRASTFLDIGANIGAIAVPMAMHAAAVVAFEPQRLLFQMLCGNAALNGVGNLHAARTAVGEAPGESMIAMPPPDFTGAAGGLSLGTTYGLAHEPITVLSIDAMAPATLDAVATIKIDVEGMELEVIRGAAETIRNRRPTLYIENDRVERSAELIATIRGFGYELYWDLPLLVRQSAPASEVTGLRSFNMLCVAAEREQRIYLEPVLGDDDRPQAAMDRLVARAA